MKHKTNSSGAVTAASSGFADRVRVLIQRVGSATEIARMCGFSEGVVRSWRDGNSDPSRARCVTLAKTLGVSLVWLVAGEGMMQPDNFRISEDQTSSQVGADGSQFAGANRGLAHAMSSTVDTKRLETALSILQSELELSSQPVSLAESSDLLSSLYAALGPGGKSVDTAAMLRFNRQLAERIRQANSALV